MTTSIGFRVELHYNNHKPHTDHQMYHLKLHLYQLDSTLQPKYEVDLDSNHFL